MFKMAYTVSDFMTRELVTVAPGDPLRRAVDAMQERGCRRLPVLENDRLVGIITETDVSDALIRLLEQPGL
jgi:acetoin utilization protein AcuB